MIGFICSTPCPSKDDGPVRSRLIQRLGLDTSHDGDKGTKNPANHIADCQDGSAPADDCGQAN